MTNPFPEYDASRHSDYHKQGLIKEETLSDWLIVNARLNQDSDAINSGTGDYSYAELETRVHQMAASLREIGLNKSDVIAVQLPNIPEFIISYLAIAEIGAVMQTLHMPYRDKELIYFLNDSKAKAIICLSRFKESSPAGNISLIAEKIEQKLSVISVGEIIKNTHNFDQLASASNTRIDVEHKSTDPFVLLYTSGTTSSPKGVPHRHINFLNNARLCAMEYGFNSGDKILSLAPLTHLYGLFTCNMSMSVAATQILLPVFSPQAFAEVLQRYQPTAIFAAPAHFAACFQNNLFNPSDFERVRFVCLSGSQVPVELAREVDSLLTNGVVGQLWGMSELQAGAITRMSDSKDKRYSTTGKATPGTELRVADDKNNSLPANEEGELQIRGLSVFDGYLNKETETKQSFTDDGWFKTGDTATLDSEGILRITGRTKNLINRGGVKYNPVEIEEIITQLPSVSQCTIVPVSDSVYGEKACIFIIEKDKESVTLDEICACLNEANVAKYKWPEKLLKINSMPLTPTNKIRIEELQNLAQASLDN